MLQGVVDADEKDENEVTGRPAKNLQSYVREVMMAKEKVRHAQCTERGENCTGIQECKMCWQRIPGNRRFDGVAVDQTNQIMYTFEFKRTLDWEHGYVQRCDERARGCSWMSTKPF